MTANSAHALAETAGRINLLGLDRQRLEAFCESLGERKFRAPQLIQWVHQRGLADFEAMSNLSKAFRKQLADVCEIHAPDVVAEHRSADGTRKWLMQVDTSNRIETVFIPEASRNTLCISSQAGCALACSFCSTAQQGFNRNLTAAEIVGQLWVAQQRLGPEVRISNVVFMGMGEPLLNLENVISATQLMMDDFAYGLSKRRVTISTSGIVPALDRLGEVSDISLAVSLHAPDDALRDQLVPINQKYPIAELLASCKRFVGDGRRKATFEYVMLEGINDSPAQAKALVRLLSHVPSKVNLIPFNPFPGSPYRCSSRDTIERFNAVLHNAGLISTIRKTRGDDIDAACGQLVGSVLDRSRRQARLRTSAA